MKYEIDAIFKWLLQVGRRKSIVDRNQQVKLFCYRGYGCNVNTLNGWIRRRLDVYEPDRRVFLQNGLDRVKIPKIFYDRIDARFRHHFEEQLVCTAIQRIVREHGITRF